MNMSRQCVRVLPVALILLSACASVEAQDRAKAALVEKKVKDLGPLPFDKDINYITLSPAGERLAYRLRDQKKDYLICDGKPGRAYDSVGEIVFSPDGGRLACHVHDPDQCFLLCDGREVGQAYKRAEIPLFSPDSRRFAYQATAAGTERSMFIVCDGEKAYPAYAVGGAVFSPDSRHLAWFATRGDRQFVVIDGMEGPEHFFVKIPERPCEVEGKFRYVAGDGKEAWLVEADWPKDSDWTNGLKPVEH